MHLFIILALYLLDSFPATTIWADLDYFSLINTLLKERASPDHPNLKSFQAFLCPGASELHIIQVRHSVTSQNHLKAKNSYKNCLSMYPPVCNNKKKYLSGKDAHKYYYSLLETTINRTIINCILFWEREQREGERERESSFPLLQSSEETPTSEKKWSKKQK